MPWSASYPGCTCTLRPVVIGLQDLANVRDEVQDPTHGAQLLARYLPNHPDSLLIGEQWQMQNLLLGWYRSAWALLHPA